MRGFVRIMAVALVALGLSVSSTSGFAQVSTIDPSDPRLVPNPVESSDEGTAWTCRLAGQDVRCNGTLTMSWELQEGPGDWCAVPLYSVNGVFTRTQTRYYTYDATSDRYLEYKRLINLNSNESLTPVPDPDSTNVVTGRLLMTWLTTFKNP